jgi:hypothetical protein
MIKSAEFDADFELVEKLAKRLIRKNVSTKRDRKMEFLTFITTLVKFFALFSKESNSALIFCVF